MPSKSKIKGSTFERDIAKKLNEYFDTDEFSRAFGSGAFVGKSNWTKRKGMSIEVKNALAGDIMVPGWFKFNIECKHYDKSPLYHNLLSSSGDNKMDEWLSKSIHDGINTNTLSLVFFKTTRIFTGIALPQSMLSNDVNHFCSYKGFVIVDIDTGLQLISNFIKLPCETQDEYVSQFITTAKTESSCYNKLLVSFLQS